MTHYTVDELSAHTGVPSRTIRFYQTQDILPPPLRSGRIALYTQEHVDRLRLVSMLQTRGLRLSAIREVMHNALSIHDWLGLDEHLSAPWTDDEPRTVATAELQRLLATDHPTITVDALQQAKLVRSDGNGTCTITSPALLDIALRLDSAGIDLDTASTAAVIIRDRLAPAADDLVAHYASRIGEGFGSEATPQELARAFDVLRPLGVEAVRIIFAQEVQRAIRELLQNKRS
jgi:DNA-binding transcriptional MerR regulator